MDERLILLVDDEEMILTTLEQVFKFEGFHPICSTDGVEALRLMQAHQIEVVFTDLRMPKMDGMELCRRAKQQNPAACVYALSAYVGHFTDNDFEDAGFAGRFAKPFEMNTIVNAAEQGFRKLAGRISSRNVESAK